jgi:hypothetical protein
MLPRTRESSFSLRGTMSCLNADFAAVWLEQADHQLQGHTLSRAASTQDAERFAFNDR